MAIFAPSESPAVIVKEVDLTGGVPNVQSTTGAFMGEFRWGPVEKATLVSNEAGLASTFAAPGATTNVDFLSAANFLRYANSLQVTRVVDSTAKNAVNSGGTATLIKNNEHWENNASYTADSDNRIFAKYPGAVGNSLRVVSTGSTGWTNWPYKANFDGAPTGTERHVLVLDEDGVITGTAGTVLERFAFVEDDSAATNTDGSSNYVKDVVNRGSNWVRVAGGLDSGDWSLASGADGSAAGASDFVSAASVFEDKDTITVDFLIAPGSGTTATNATITDELVRIAETRKDCVVVASPASENVINNADPVTATTAETNAMDWSSYLIVDNNWLKVYDKYNDTYVYIPAASSTAGIMAASDNDNAPWFSPAGVRRGQYFGVTNLAYTPTKAQRDTLYKAGVNPIANLPGQGILLYGDKTHLNRPSAFDRINVRRLFVVIERAIGLAARNTLFELNDEFTRAEFVNIVEPFLREIKGRRGITDFRVVCDETNNTPDIIDRNEFIANIFIKPARSINYITLNFVAVRTGVDFEEVAGLSV